MRLLFGCLVLSCVGVARGDIPTGGGAPAIYEAACNPAFDGDAKARRQILKEAIEADPDYAPARAELGQVLVDGRWRPAGYAAKMAAYDPRQTEYQELRSEAENTLKDHRRLAKWSEAQGLAPETRIHWLSVLQIDPNNREALRGLNAEWRDGVLWDQELFAKEQVRQEEIARSAEGWQTRFVSYIKHPTAMKLAAIREEINASAAGPIETLAGRLQPTEVELALIAVFLDRVEEMPEVEVTAALCRMALLAPREQVRTEVIQYLASRPKADSVPILLNGLVPIIESTSRVSKEGLRIVYERRLTTRTADRDTIDDRVRTWRGWLVRPFAPPGVRGLSRYDQRVGYGDGLALWRLRYSMAIEMLGIQLEEARTTSQVARHNEGANAVNQRVIAALMEVTGVALGDEPLAWWEWWQRHSGYDNYTRAVSRYLNEDHDRSIESGPYRSMCSCFIAGTPIWTRTGPKPIETLQPGELVLSRDPQRGGLVYRAVLDTTIRQPSPTYSIVAGSESIVCTEGHPFWVIGRGWRMAKQLQDGDVLSTVSGPTEIESIEEAEPATAYNLIVEGASNYYVGESGVLVHDNTPRLPAVGLIARR